VREVVLIIAPHPDDEIIGVGGTIAKLIEIGAEVFVVYVTNGNPPCPGYTFEEFTRIRRKETIEAARILGLKEENLIFFDEKPWEINPTKVRFKLLEQIRVIRPYVVFIPSPDQHLDHIEVHKVSVDAVKMAPSKWFSPVEHNFKGVCEILVYEVQQPIQSPNVFIDITEQLDKKLRALRCHKTQNVEKYLQLIKGLAMFRGSFVGKKFAEAFERIY